MEHIYFNFQHHVLKYLICLVIAIKMPNICTRYHFATLFDTNRRIAVYSAYYFQPSDGGGREKRWFVEPQVGVNFFFCFNAPAAQMINIVGGVPLLSAQHGF